MEQELIKHVEACIADPYKQHFAYNQLIRYYYGLRNEDSYYMNRLIVACENDIELFPQFIVAFRNSVNPPYPETLIPSIPSFRYLCRVYEKIGMIDQAIRICELAIKYGVDDNTKGGFEGRLDRLKKNNSSRLTRDSS